MAMTNVELYEALKGSIPERAARMIAEAFHPAQELVTKSDLVQARSELQIQITQLQGEVRSLPTMRWMLGMFVPVWMGVWGTVIAVILKG